MKPVDQICLYENPKKRGDCFRACVASILELPSEAVPHFLQLATDAGDEMGWSTLFVQWCSKEGVDFYSTVTPPQGYSIMSGKAERGVLHSVVALDGKLAHDPHPSRAGLIDVLDFIVLHKPEARP